MKKRQMAAAVVSGGGGNGMERGMKRPLEAWRVVLVVQILLKMGEFLSCPPNLPLDAVAEGSQTGD